MCINLVQVSALMLLCLAHLNMKVGVRQHLEVSQRQMDGEQDRDYVEKINKMDQL